ncbi:uncharacterized protein MONOS_18588 [Monocercomonoides exilis]|uniref:uncharacterized protein n=1 Tax=Monocercomonoides exilis TaxID=2049356 RepID=UPI00355A8B9E|nr:hypothetical protein MONOS_18588 [Monocercomonoides exilis]
MSLPNNISEDRIQMMSKTKQFSKLFRELEHCREDEQMQKMEEMKRMMDEMNGEEFKSIFTKELFDEMGKNIEEKKMSIKNIVHLLKLIGYDDLSTELCSKSFNESFMSKIVQNMVVEEEKKKERMNESLLIDLCECYLMLNDNFFSEKLLSICVPNLLQVALKKEVCKEVQKDVELALTALSCISTSINVKQEWYLNKIKEIIQYHQKHHNLTHLAYQSAWQFLIFRFCEDKSFKELIVNELHFAREAIKELEELTDCRKRKKKEKKSKYRKTEKVFMRWVISLLYYVRTFQLLNEEHIELVHRLVCLHRADIKNEIEILESFVIIFWEMSGNESVCIDILLKEGAFDEILKEIQLSTSKNEIIYYCLAFYLKISDRLKEKKYDEKEEKERKELKRKVHEKIEEEGYEDVITSFYQSFDFFNNQFYFELSLDISDYFVNA